MSKKILLADDSITIQKVIELTFSDEDFEVVTVGNGRLAIERVQDVRPDLVLCDIIMPEKDGYEVCDFIKKNPALSRTPVLLLTGAFEPFDQERATRVGCDGFLAKPFEPQTLIAKVKDLLGRAGAAPAAPPAPVAAAAPPAPTPAPAWTKYAAPAVAASPPPQPEPFAFVPEPPPTHEPPRPAAAMPFEEAGVSFFTDETFEEIAQEKPVARSGDTAPVPTFPETPDFAEYRGSAFDEVAPPAPSIAFTAPPVPPPAPAPAPVAAARPAAGPGGFPALDEEDGPQTLLHVSSEEMATLRGEPARPAAAPPPPTPSPAPAPVSPRAPLWTQQTMEVPLETRARVAMEAASHAESEPVFEEAFEPAPAPAPPRPPTPPPPAAPSPGRAPASVAPPAPAKEPTPAPRPAVVPRPESSAPPSRPTPPPAPAPTPVVAPVSAPAPALPAPVAAAAPAVAPPPFAPVAAAASASTPARPSPQDPETLSVRGASDGAGARSSGPPAGADAAAANASGVSVPVDMVSQIAQRVVAQISEKVIREVAWEVIPDLAEVLINKEIERLKAELQQT